MYMKNGHAQVDEGRDHAAGHGHNRQPQIACAYGAQDDNELGYEAGRGRDAGQGQEEKQHECGSCRPLCGQALVAVEGLAFSTQSDHNAKGPSVIKT